MSVADDDVAQAILTRFAADGQLPVLIPGGLRRGREVAAVTANTPYAVLEVGDGERKAEYSTGGVYLDYRMVTITIYGLEAAVRAALAQIQKAYDPAPSGGNGLTIPNATHRVTWPLSRHVEQDPATKSGEDIWRGIARYEVISNRSWGGN